MDFSKAFDKVSHNLLMHKQEHYGIRGMINNWMESFLSGRTQAVIVEVETSTYLPVDSGVPQGIVYLINRFQDMIVKAIFEFFRCLIT
jgi:hypothetical protein